MQNTFDESLINGLSEAANQHDSENFSGPLVDAINALMNASETEGKDVIDVVSGELPKISSPHGAAALAVWLGAMVESGHAPNSSFRSVRDAFLRWAATVQTKEDEVAEGPEGAFLALENCGRSLVSHASRDEATLVSLRSDELLAQELKRLESDSLGAAWLMELLTQLSAELIVLNVEKQAGALVKYENISKCFHLFTLLQGVLGDWLPEGKQTRKALMECARGISSAEENDQARWHFAQPDCPESTLASSVWGEAHISSIGKVDGLQVMILWPMILEGRGWDSGFFGPQLQCKPPDVKLLHFLSNDEFLKWKVRLQLPDKVLKKVAASEKKAWWKIW